jgi:hypothetical protein
VGYETTIPLFEGSKTFISIKAPYTLFIYTVPTAQLEQCKKLSVYRAGYNVWGFIY